MSYFLLALHHAGTSLQLAAGGPKLDSYANKLPLFWPTTPLEHASYPTVMQYLARQLGASAQLGLIPQRWTAVGSLAARSYAIERDSGQSAPPKPSEPFVEEDNQGNIDFVAKKYEETLALKSGTAEDVQVKDKAEGSLSKMQADPSKVDEPYKQRARDSVSAMERFSESPDIASAVMDTEESTEHALQDQGVTGSKETLPRPHTATAPK